MDDQIAEHASSHWPGLTIDQIKVIIREVRSGYQDALELGTGRRIYRKGDLILIEDGQGAGTLFRPWPKSATQYFADFVEDELGGSPP